jgi:Bestrophin, RFP-TM, chloride channel
MFRFVSSLLVALAATRAAAFAPSQSHAKFRNPTELYGNTKYPPPSPPIQDISYGEESRKYRRTIYTHDDWVKHRSPDRFWRNLRAIVASGVYKNLYKEVGATTAVAAFIVVWNGLTNGYDTFSGEHMDGVLNSLPMLVLPLAPFTLSSPSLGLLLGRSFLSALLFWFFLVAWNMFSFHKSHDMPSKKSYHFLLLTYTPVSFQDQHKLPKVRPFCLCLHGCKVLLFRLFVCKQPRISIRPDLYPMTGGTKHERTGE